MPSSVSRLAFRINIAEVELYIHTAVYCTHACSGRGDPTHQKRRMLAIGSACHDIPMQGVIRREGGRLRKASRGGGREGGWDARKDLRPRGVCGAVAGHWLG